MGTALCQAIFPAGQRRAEPVGITVGGWAGDVGGGRGSVGRRLARALP